MKSNHSGPVIPEKLKSFERLDKRATECKDRIPINRSKNYIAVTKSRGSGVVFDV